MLNNVEHLVCPSVSVLAVIHPMFLLSMRKLIGIAGLSRHGCTSRECHQRADGSFTRGRNSCEFQAGSCKCMIADERCLTLPVIICFWLSIRVKSVYFPSLFGIFWDDDPTSLKLLASLALVSFGAAASLPRRTSSVRLRQAAGGTLSDVV